MPVDPRGRRQQAVKPDTVDDIEAVCLMSTQCVHVRRLRSLDGGMFSDSRYLAMVRRATLMPCSSSIFAILLSLSGLRGVSAATIFLIRARIAVEENSPPAAVPTWLEKKYLSSNIPRGVCMYFCVVTREMVDSCMLTASAISCSTSGFIASSPCSRKSC